MLRFSFFMKNMPAPLLLLFPQSLLGQTNAATAEENSATSEEMSAQAATLREEVGKFKLDAGHGNERTREVPLPNGRAGEGAPALEVIAGRGKY